MVRFIMVYFTRVELFEGQEVSPCRTSIYCFFWPVLVHFIMLHQLVVLAFQRKPFVENYAHLLLHH